MSETILPSFTTTVHVDNKVLLECLINHSPSKTISMLQSIRYYNKNYKDRVVYIITKN